MAFSEEEQAAILETEVKNGTAENPEGAAAGPDTLNVYTDVPSLSGARVLFYPLSA